MKGARSNVYSIRFSDREREILQQISEYYGCSDAETIRHLIVSHMEEIKEEEEENGVKWIFETKDEIEKRKISFYKFMKTKSKMIDKETPEMDFYKDMLNDSTFPKDEKSYRKINFHLLANRACLKAMGAFNNLFLMYKSECNN